MFNLDKYESFGSISSTKPPNEYNPIDFLMGELPKLKTIQKNQLLANEISAIMRLFSPQRGQSIKKENLRVSVIRNHKKYLRMIFYPKKSHQTYLKTALKSGDTDLCFQHFKDHSLLHIKILMPICIPSFGPKSERKVLRESASHNCSKTFYDYYLYNYFKVEEIKYSFLVYLDFLFADFNMPKLSKELKLKCCGSDEHSEECRQKWKRLKIFFSNVSFQF